MLIRRVSYLGLLACLVTTTALGIQPTRLGSGFVEQEAEADAPGEESGEEEVKSDTGIPTRRRGTVLVPTTEVLPFGLRNPNRLVTPPPLVSFHAAVNANRNGFGGPLRL